MLRNVRKQIVDKNGVLTWRWVKPDVPEASATRVTNVITVPKTEKPRLLGAAPIPELSFQNLYHVGDLNPDSKKGWSLEGSGMSVSRHPVEWSRIARLSGDIHEFNVPENRFLDYHSLTDDQKSALDQWGLEKGYIEPVTLYRVTRWDAEADSEMTMTFEGLDEAMEETDEDGFDPEPFDGFRATDEYPDKFVDPLDYQQVLAAIWVSETAPELDGVWWEDNLDVLAYSAPRGVLSMNKIAEWVDSSVP